MQPGLKNLTDHFLEEWFWRPAAIVSYSAGRLCGARAATAWHGTLSEMGMVVVASTIAVGPIAQTLSVDGAPIGEAGKALEGSFPRFADDLMWWVKAPRRNTSANNRRTDKVSRGSVCSSLPLVAAVFVRAPHRARRTSASSLCAAHPSPIAPAGCFSVTAFRALEGYLPTFLSVDGGPSPYLVGHGAADARRVAIGG